MSIEILISILLFSKINICIQLPLWYGGWIAWYLLAWMGCWKIQGILGQKR